MEDLNFRKLSSSVELINILATQDVFFFTPDWCFYKFGTRFTHRCACCRSARCGRISFKSKEDMLGIVLNRSKLFKHYDVNTRWFDLLLPMGLFSTFITLNDLQEILGHT